MSPIDFDYQGFANTLAAQASEAMPDIKPEYKQFLVSTIQDFAIKAGNALANEDTTLLDLEKVQQIVQYIAEWTYHKGLELVHSQIPPDYWQFILQTIAGGLFETGKKAMIAGGLDETTISNIIQTNVEHHFQQALNQLKEQGYLQDEQIISIAEAHKKAQEQIVIEQPQQQREMPTLNQRQSKLAAIAVVLTTFPQDKVQQILKNFSQEEAETIKYFMLPENLNQQVDTATTLALLKSLKNTIAPAEAPNMMAKNIQKLAASGNSVKIINMLQKERPIVQNYVKACMDGKFIRRDFSVYLAKSIYKYLEKQLSIT